ncbi:MAG: endonuclease V [Candidatus Thermoplasmatota archaeon]|nr:endonuclease V [Candidatus Thermoplasmatota archaeon]
MDLYKEIKLLVEQIPEGKFSTYRTISIALGDEIACSAVKKVLKEWRKKYNVVSSGNESNASYFFNEFKTCYPLKKLREEQISLRNKVITKDRFKEVETVAGIDVACAGDKAYGACVEIDTDGNIIKRKVTIKKLTFPYIPTYLSYRELPVLHELIDKEKPSVVMIDGNGILHPRQMGMASHFGVLHSIPSIGIAKKLLCGKIKGKYVFMDGEKIGAIYGAGKPIYVSPGHKISLGSSLAITKKFCRCRIPEPIRQAHILANKAKNENNL